MHLKFLIMAIKNFFSRYYQIMVKILNLSEDKIEVLKDNTKTNKYKLIKFNSRKLSYVKVLFL